MKARDRQCDACGRTFAIRGRLLPRHNKPGHLGRNRFAKCDGSGTEGSQPQDATSLRIDADGRLRDGIRSLTDDHGAALLVVCSDDVFERWVAHLRERRAARVDGGGRS